MIFTKRRMTEFGFDWLNVNQLEDNVARTRYICGTIPFGYVAASDY